MGGSAERLVCVTGILYGGILRIVDVDITGNPIGSPSYLPANQIISEMDLIDGYLIDKIEGDEPEQEIDWTAHEDQPGDITIDETAGNDDAFVSGEGRPNPMLAALQIKRD